MTSRTIRGTRAAVKWAYYDAAAIHAYAVTRDDRGAWSVSASLTPGTTDAYKLAQRPLYLVAPLKRGAWRWEIRTFTIDPVGRLAGALGPMITEGPYERTHATTRY